MNSSFHNVPDDDLVLLIKQDDQAAIDEIFNRYWLRLFKAADKLLQDEQLSKDIVQDIFVDVWEKRQERNIVKLDVYLHQAVKYKVISQLRRGKFKSLHEQRLEQLGVTNETVNSLELNDLNDSVGRILNAMPSRQREIFYLSRFKYLDNKSIASKFNISIRTVEAQISKALKLLRLHLEVWLLLALFTQL